MKVLVVGGAGFLGSAVTRRLLGEGHDAVIFDNFSTGARQAVRAVERIEGDLACEEDLRRLFRNHRFDVTCWAIGATSTEGELPELLGDPHRRWQRHLSHLLDFFRIFREYGVTPLVACSTLEVYGSTQRGPARGERGEAPAPDSSGGRLAQALESFLLDAHAATAFRLAIVRFGWLCGADLEGELGDDRPRPYHWLSRLLRSPRLAPAAPLPAVASPGGADAGADRRERRYEVLHVLDAARAVVAAVEHVATGGSGIFDAGTGRPVTPSDVVAKYQDLTGRGLPSVPAPPPRALEVDPQPLREAMGWEPERSDLKSILEDAIQWRARFPDGYRSADDLRARQEASQAELFGEIAMRLGFLTPADVVRALELQKRRRDEGAEHKLFGLILLEHGLLNNIQLIEVLRYYEEVQRTGTREWRLQN